MKNMKHRYIHPILRAAILVYTSIFVALLVLTATVRLIGDFIPELLIDPNPGTGSMEPTSTFGDIDIFLQTDELAIGDYCIYAKEPGKITAHRIVALSSDAVVFKGDANRETDKVVHINQVLPYKGVCTIPLVGLPSSLAAAAETDLHTPLERIICVFVLATTCATFATVLIAWPKKEDDNV